ncbi:MAG: AI-2E family transporter [Deltaproteobacteria bacterium]|nr:AI-2E family transporter [Deltaproteobacteria bacterium]
MQVGQTRHKIHLLALFTGVFLLCVVLYVGRVAEIVIIAALLAYLLDPVVTAIEVKGVSRTLAASLLMLFILFVFMLFWYTVIPIAIDQLMNLQAGTGSKPALKAIASLEGYIRRHGEAVGLGNISLTEELGKFKTGLIQKIPDFIIKDSVSLLLGCVMVPFIMFFILKDGREFKKYFISLVPNRYFEFTLDLLYKMEVQLGNYLRGQFLDAVVFGVLATITLWALNVPYFVVIGCFAGLANLIPFVGPLVGALAAMVAVVLEQGDIARGASVLIAFVILKLVDDFAIQPLAVGRHVNLHPMVVAIAIIVGGHLFGVLGMLLAVPSLGFFKVVLEESIDTYRRYRFD